MTTIVIGIQDWGRELRAIPKRDHQALIKAAQMTAFVDAPRWIQWSIRGGGVGGDTGAVTPKTSISKPRRKKGKKPTAWGAVLDAVKKLLGGRKSGKKPSASRSLKGAKRRRKNSGCERRTPPPYRIPIDTGDYANSWTAVKVKGGAMIYSASNPRIKAGVIEFGRRPGKGIPISPLAAWVERKLGCSDPKKARSIAIAISKAAKRDGRKGLFVMRRARPKIEEAFRKNTIALMKKAHRGVGAEYKKGR